MITTEKPHEVCDVVIVVIFLEAQAELGGAQQIDVGITRGSNRDAVPVVHRREAK